MNERQKAIELREQLADLCHKQWSGWLKYMFGKCLKKTDGTILIPEWAVTRWRRQAYTPYSKLSSKEQDSDRAEADRFIALLRPKLKTPTLNEMAKVRIEADGAVHARKQPTEKLHPNKKGREDCENCTFPERHCSDCINGDQRAKIATIFKPAEKPCKTCGGKGILIQVTKSSGLGMLGGNPYPCPDCQEPAEKPCPTCNDEIPDFCSNPKHFKPAEKPKCLGCMLDSLTKEHDKDCTASPENQRKLKPAEKPATSKTELMHQPMKCVQHGGSPTCEKFNVDWGLICPDCQKYDQKLPESKFKETASTNLKQSYKKLPIK